MIKLLAAHGADLAVDQNLAGLDHQLGLSAGFRRAAVFEQIDKDRRCLKLRADVEKIARLGKIAQEIIAGADGDRTHRRPGSASQPGSVSQPGSFSQPGRAGRPGFSDRPGRAEHAVDDLVDRAVAAAGDQMKLLATAAVLGGRGACKTFRVAHALGQIDAGLLPACSRSRCDSFPEGAESFSLSRLGVDDKNSLHDTFIVHFLRHKSSAAFNLRPSGL